MDRYPAAVAAFVSSHRRSAGCYRELVWHSLWLFFFPLLIFCAAYTSEKKAIFFPLNDGSVELSPITPVPMSCLAEACRGEQGGQAAELLGAVCAVCPGLYTCSC